jgi:transcriptional regulator with XRE-family HTH domain
VAGLRREEVAELAGIGVTWYTWLEQARSVNVSAPTLERIATALALDKEEREHLFLLGDQHPPLPVEAVDDRLMATVKQVLASLEPNPAYVLNPRWDLIAWNGAARNVFGDFGKMPEGRRNIVWLTFTDKDFRRMFVDWERFARCVLAHFRADSAAHTGDPRWSELTDALIQQSAEFRHWWTCHEVAWSLDWSKELVHPRAGTLSLNSIQLDLHRPINLKLVAYMPAPGSDTAEHLLAFPSSQHMLTLAR